MSNEMTQQEWNTLDDQEKEEIRDLSFLSPQLIGLEDWRVEVVDKYGDRRRFYVGRSTGWKPIHIEIPRRDSWGGGGADKEYVSVERLYKR